MYQCLHKGRQRTKGYLNNERVRPQLTKKEFETYLLIYAAYADYDFHPKEEQFIIELFGTDVFNKMHKLFQSNSDYATLQLVTRYKDEFLDNNASKKDMYQTITKLFTIDGDYSRGEKTFLQFLDKIIESDAIV